MIGLAKRGVSGNATKMLRRLLMLSAKSSGLPRGAVCCRVVLHISCSFSVEKIQAVAFSLRVFCSVTK